MARRHVDALARRRGYAGEASDKGSGGISFWAVALGFLAIDLIALRPRRKKG